MGVCQIYDHVDRRGKNVIEAWLDKLNPKALAKVHAKIMMLRQNGGELPTGVLSDSGVKHIKKLRITGRINWRVFLCKGPVDSDTEFTLIDAVQEKDNKVPDGVIDKAADSRTEIAASPNSRRKQHDFKKYGAKP